MQNVSVQKYSRAASYPGRGYEWLPSCSVWQYTKRVVLSYILDLIYSYQKDLPSSLHYILYIESILLLINFPSHLKLLKIWAALLVFTYELVHWLSKQLNCSSGKDGSLYDKGRVLQALDSSFSAKPPNCQLTWILQSRLYEWCQCLFVLLIYFCHLEGNECESAVIQSCNISLLLLENIEKCVIAKNSWTGGIVCSACTKQVCTYLDTWSRLILSGDWSIYDNWRVNLSRGNVEGRWRRWSLLLIRERVARSPGWALDPDFGDPPEGLGVRSSKFWPLNCLAACMQSAGSHRRCTWLFLPCSARLCPLCSLGPDPDLQVPVHDSSCFSLLNCKLLGAGTRSMLCPLYGTNLSLSI